MIVATVHTTIAAKKTYKLKGLSSVKYATASHIAKKNNKTVNIRKSTTGNSAIQNCIILFFLRNITNTIITNNISSPITSYTYPLASFHPIKGVISLKFSPVNDASSTKKAINATCRHRK